MVDALRVVAWGDTQAHGGQLSHMLRDLEVRAGARPAYVVCDHYSNIQQLTDGDSLRDIVAKITAYDGDDWLKNLPRRSLAAAPQPSPSFTNN